MTTAPGMHTLQVGIDVHMEVVGDGRWTAHSFDPNLVVKLCSPRRTSQHHAENGDISHAVDFVALRDIEVDEILSIDYTATEWETAGGGFVCEASGREVRGFKHLTEEEKKRLLQAGMLPAHVLRLWLAERLGCSPGIEFPG